MAGFGHLHSPFGYRAISRQNFERVTGEKISVDLAALQGFLQGFGATWFSASHRSLLQLRYLAKV
jgi:hypothetical protein